MAEPRSDALVKSVEGLLAEKEAIAPKEKGLIEELNAVLRKMGYQVVGLRPRRDRAGQGTGKKPGRPPGSGKGQAAKGEPGRPPGSP